MLLGLCLSCAIAYAGIQPTGSLIDFRGGVSVISSSGGNSENAFVNRPLYPGETVVTGSDGWAAILLADESLVQLSRNTTFTLKAVAACAGWFDVRKTGLSEGDAPRTSSYRMERGRLWLRNSNRNLSIDVHTPTVSAGIRGTELDISVSPDRDVSITVVAGRIVVWNDRERMPAAARDVIVARPGMPIQKTQLLTPLNAVQWTVTLPDFLASRPTGIMARLSSSAADETTRLLAESRQDVAAGNLENALQRCRDGFRQYPDDSALALHLAYLLILDKMFDEARSLLEQSIRRWPQNGEAYSLHALAVLLAGDTDAAVTSAAEGTRRIPDSDFAWLVSSIVLQSRFKLPQAIQAARNAIAINDRNGDAHIQLARLQFGSDRLDEALGAIDQARRISTNRPEILGLEGFLHLALRRTEVAAESFENLTGRFPGYAEGHMGLAIARMRQGRVAEAMQAIATASLLEPQRALYVSYFGKMLYQIGRLDKAIEVLEHAIRLDPRDPTPYLYRAIIRYDLNLPTQALSDLQTAMALNDNQAVYRSRFLLDRDLAVNHVDQSVVFNSLGLSEWARSRALDSVKLDYANAPAHIFLAGAYNAMEDRAKAGATEILLSLLMAPANVNSMNTYNRYTSLFEKPAIEGSLDGTLGDDASATNLIVSSNLPRANLAFDAIAGYDDSDGWRGSDTYRAKGFNGKLKWDPTPTDGFLINMSASSVDKGDQDTARYEYDAISHPDDWSENDSRYVTLGYRRNLGQHSDLLLVYKHQETDQDLFTRSFFFLDDEQFFLVDNHQTVLAQLPFDKVQGQYQTRWGDHQIIAGALWFERDEDAAIDEWEDYYYWIDDAYYWLDSDSFSTQQQVSERYRSCYLQDIWRATPDLTFEAALHYDQARQANLFSGRSWRADGVNPRFGAIWKTNATDTLRLGLFSYYASPVWQRLDPPDIAGIPIYRNTYEGTTSREADVVWERDWTTGFFSVNLFTQKSEVEEEVADDTMQSWESALWGVEAAWNQILGEGLGCRATCRFREIENDSAPQKDRQEYMASATLRYQHPSGFFSGVQETFRYDRFDERSPGGETIWITDIQAGLALPGKRGRFTISVNNLFDRHFNWVADDFVFTAGRVPVRRFYMTLALFF